MECNPRDRVRKGVRRPAAISCNPREGLLASIRANRVELQRLIPPQAPARAGLPSTRWRPPLLARGYPASWVDCRQGPRTLGTTGQLAWCAAKAPNIAYAVGLEPPSMCLLETRGGRCGVSVAFRGPRGVALEVPAGRCWSSVWLSNEERLVRVSPWCGSKEERARRVQSRSARRGPYRRVSREGGCGSHYRCRPPQGDAHRGGHRWPRRGTRPQEKSPAASLVGDVRPSAPLGELRVLVRDRRPQHADTPALLPADRPLHRRSRRARNVLLTSAFGLTLRPWRPIFTVSCGVNLVQPGTAPA